MNLDERNRHRQKRVSYRDARVGISTRVYDYAVDFSVRFLDNLRYPALIITLHRFTFQTEGFCRSLYVFFQLRITFRAVFFGFSHAEHVKVYAVDNQYFLFFHSRCFHSRCFHFRCFHFRNTRPFSGFARGFVFG